MEAATCPMYGGELVGKRCGACGYTPSVYSCPRFRKSVFGFFYKARGDPFRADDDTQETFVRILRRKGKDARLPMRYVWKAAYCQLVDGHRRDKAERRLLEPLDAEVDTNADASPRSRHEEVAAASDDPDERMDLVRIRSIFDELVEKKRLKAIDVRILFLRRIEQKTCGEIGEILGMPERSVSTKYRRAIKKFARALRARGFLR